MLPKHVTSLQLSLWLSLIHTNPSLTSSFSLSKVHMFTSFSGQRLHRLSCLSCYLMNLKGIAYFEDMTQSYHSMCLFDLHSCLASLAIHQGSHISVYLRGCPEKPHILCGEGKVSIPQTNTSSKSKP
jgi:hypothetical protein